MINKKGFQTKNLIIGAVLFSAVVVLFGLSFTGFSANYPNNPTIVNDNIVDNYNELQTQLNTVEIMQNESLGEEGLEFRGNFDVTFGSFFTVMKLMFGTTDLISDMAANLVNDFDFINPTAAYILLSVLFVIITVLLIFQLINAVGRNPI
jgi:hypothetical protein